MTILLSKIVPRAQLVAVHPPLGEVEWPGTIEHIEATLGEALDPSQIPRIYKAMARRAGLEPEALERLSGHSTRVGAAQDMIACGLELPAILQAGRWKSTAMVNRYGERLPACSERRLAREQFKGLCAANDNPPAPESGDRKER